MLETPRSQNEHTEADIGGIHFVDLAEQAEGPEEANELDQQQLVGGRQLLQQRVHRPQPLCYLRRRCVMKKPKLVKA